ncbi:Stalked cell differentiation-controlling protein [Hartmannibacter diazotrophicus]|uniref:diguanylate cyclase n=1 Tax=Hartmannibacter diazotrophicus TaxID=1482074 RepID=A0A2C9D9S7_9HYPH|nr:GGDEF domain-containing protein [Hartmannibacter diazotrophicus]SON56491.1 Stalked cell differentiation-controlling protein [Hartmannibacter diazotrophicus]
MSGRDEFQRTIAYGEAAIGQLKRNEIAAYPRNYELWYTYCAGFNHALNKAINEILRARGVITMDEVNKIYAVFLSPSRIADRIDDVGTRISGELSGVVGAMEKSIIATSDYCTSLNGASTALEGATDSADVSEIVQTLISETRKTEAVNRELEVQLAESRRQIAELHESLDAIRFESLTDELTTLANRKHFDQSIERAIAQASEEDEPFSLLVTDIDHFKNFNDTYGHQTGDQVLRLVGLSVKQNVKGHDIACRYGGEEFAIILPRCNLKGAAAVAEQIRVAVMSKELMKRSTGENLGNITISIGVATFNNRDSVQSIIERADSALYLAKHTGRNRVCTENDLKMESRSKKTKTVA